MKLFSAYDEKKKNPSFVVWGHRRLERIWGGEKKQTTEGCIQNCCVRSARKGTRY